MGRFGLKLCVAISILVLGTSDIRHYRALNENGPAATPVHFSCFDTQFDTQSHLTRFSDAPEELIHHV
jgi:hypothetical protein